MIYNKYLIIINLLFSLCLCEISVGQKEKLLAGFIEYYNNLPNQIYACNEGSSENTQQVDKTTYQIVANIKVSELHNIDVTKLFKCIVTLQDSGDNGINVVNYNCQEDVHQSPAEAGGSQDERQQSQIEVTEPLVERNHIKLDNEVQSDAVITSGEQFIAIPRGQPSASCSGCASHVNPRAAGVSDLAQLGVRHLDFHEPSVKHSLDSVLDVERQVQVVNGVRYILTLSINFNNCSEVELENCASSKTCKITVLVKPWFKLPNGANYKAILGNNCTEEWQYGDDGEVLPEVSSDNRVPKEHDDFNASDNDIRLKHQKDVESQPNQERFLTDKEIKNLQEQIIPSTQFRQATEPIREPVSTSPDASDESKQRGLKFELVKNENFVADTDQIEQNTNINSNKKKDIDDLLNYFDFSGFKAETEGDKLVPRTKRSYEYDLKVLSIAEEFHEIKKSIENAKFVYEMAQAMVDYLNEMDMEVKNRAIKNVIKAEEEVENLQRFVYIQVRVTLPCDKVECEPKDALTQICNGVIDSTNTNSPQILNTFCYNDNKERDYRDVIKHISLDDPVLQTLTREAVNKIESESTSSYAIKINKIVAANTQITTGTLSKISIIIDNINCNKSVPLALRFNCTVIEHLGSKICEVIVHERHWLKERKISYTCTERPTDIRISKSKSINKNITIDDPKIVEMLQEVILYLETQSDRSNKQKILNIKSISSQIIAGFLTKIEFVVGYTNCTDENFSRDLVNTCELLINEGLRICKAQIWDRSWIIDGRQVEVSCDDFEKTNEIENTRGKRSIDSTGGQIKQSVNNFELENKKLADESLNKFLKSSSSRQHYEVVKIDRVTVRTISGKLTRIDFTISPTNCLIEGNGIPSLPTCNIVNSKNITHCHAKILEQVWLDKKQYSVNCNTKNEEQYKQEHLDGIKERNPRHPKYYELAADSLKKYLHDIGNSLYYRIVRVEKVTTQIVSGLLTSIDFVISPMNESGIIGSDNSNCQSIILEKHWLGTKEINVTCQMKKTTKTKDSVEQNLKNPKYMQIAVESLTEYIKSNPDSHLARVTFIDKVFSHAGITEIDFVASTAEDNDGDTICHAEFSERKQFRNDIKVKCYLIGKVLKKTEVTEEDPTYFQYIQLADESFHNYLLRTNSSQSYTIISIENVTVQWNEGINTVIQFTASPVDLDDNNLHGKRCICQIREQPWLHKKIINVNCEVDKGIFKTKRHVLNTRELGNPADRDPTDPNYKVIAEESDRNGNQRVKRSSKALLGGEVLLDLTDPKYKVLAEESLQKYVKDSGFSQVLQVTQIEKITTQVVAGSLTRIDFKASSSPGSNTITCHSKIWERPWLNQTEINVSCRNDNQRVKRSAGTVVGGEVRQDPTDPKYKVLADESLQKYVKDSGFSQALQVTQIEKITTQVVAGSLTRIDFKASSSPGSNTITCHSKIWERPWLNQTDININCQEDTVRIKKNQIDYNQGSNTNRERSEENTKKKVQLQVGNLPVNIEEDHDPNKEEYKLLAEESLRKYEQKSSIYHQVIQVKRVVTRMVSGLKYMIDFSAAPTACPVNVSKGKARSCKALVDVILVCHADILDRPWLQKKRIQVQCSGPDDDDFDEYGSEFDASDDMFKTSDLKSSNDKKYKLLAEEASEKYLATTKTKYVHKVTDIHSFSEHIASGSITKIEFSISPTTCLRNESRDSNHTCEIKHPLVVFNCNARIWDRPWLHIEKDIKVNCKKMNKRRKRALSVRKTRQISDDDDAMEEDTTFYYADRAVQHVNDQAHSNNLHKLVTIHAVQSSVQMKTVIVRMYIELAETYCLRHHKEVNLQDCEEMDGLNHRLCLARLWPSPDDELVVRHVSVVCDDDQEFASITALHIPELLKLSITNIERSSDNKFKLIHQGEPQVIPTLDSKQPIKLNFIIATTNCSKDVNLDKNPFQCYIQTTIPSKVCQSFIWLEAQTKTIRYIDASCNPPVRIKRSLSDPANVTLDNLQIQNLVKSALEKLEMSSLHRYKQRVLQINSHSTKITSGKVTTIDFDVGYTSCLKYEWVENITSCDFIEHLPRRRCVAKIWERLWISNGKNIDVNCVDDETPLESHIEFASAEMANQLAREALKHIEAKYPHPRKQKIVRIFSLEKQIVAGLHYRMKVEVGLTDCVALSEQSDCKLDKDQGMNKFCRINVWIRPWTDHPPNYRVFCDFQEGATHDLYHQVQAEHLFYNFLTTYNPSYVNDYSQMQRRFEIFKANVKKIHEFNVYEKGTATYGVTRFTDLTYEEFSSRYMGLKTSLKDANQLPMKKADIPDIKVPENFDWREYDAVTDVKDQGSCGSCWAFSVTGNIEGQWKMQSGKLVSLSEQELVDCDKLDDGCNGGLPDNAYRAIEQLGGLELEIDYPYEAEDEKCEFNKTLAKVQINGAVNITTNETGMVQWLVHNGPISIGINANAMQFYMGGISHPWKMLCNPTNLDHGVLIVGYGVKEYPLFHKRLPYWIVKNSWGKSWGEQGYYRVYRGDGTCGVNQMASSAVI